MDFYGDFRIGGPFTVIGGFNPDLGFATTNNASRSHEFYALQLDRDRPERYLFSGRSLPFERETVAVEYRDGEIVRSALRELLSTAIGPVFHRDSTHAYVLRTAADGDHRAGEQWLAMMRAGSLDEWKDAMRMGARTTSNFTYADRAGNIVHFYNARIPLLPHEPTGDSAALARSWRDMWSELVPVEDLPLWVNPPGGYLHLRKVGEVDMPVPYELIVVDDGSHDGAVDKIARDWVPNAVDVIVVKARRNQGKGAALRFAIAHVTTAVTVFLDADGDLDMVVANEAPPNRLLLNDGRGRFADASDRMVSSVPLHTREVHVFDATSIAPLLVRFGDPDLIALARHSRGRVLIRMGEIRDGVGFLDEASAFLNQVMGLDLSTQDIAALETRTEGWIAGLQLAALSLQGRAPNDVTAFIEAFSGSHRYVMDYLADEVLQQQPPEIQQFLLQTSFLASIKRCTG